MRTPIGESEIVEKRIDVRVLNRLGAVLAAELGAAGVGGAAIADRIAGSVAMECLGCGIGVSGGDLMAAALAGETGEGLNEKQRRLRLGYCARKTCQADFYAVRFQPVPGLDWDAIWGRIEPALAGDVAIRVQRPSLAVQVWQLMEAVVRQVGRPVPLAVIAVLLLAWWVRSGARIPGISPPPRVFVVPADPPPSRTPKGL